MTQAELQGLDQKILDNVRSLCQQLEITNYNPMLISWVSMIPAGKGRMVEMPFDECLLSRSQLTLPAGMRDRLEPEEWNPIIASALFAGKKLRRHILSRTLMGLAGFIVLAIALFLALPVLLPTPVRSCTNGAPPCSILPQGFVIALDTAPFMVLIGTLVVGIVFARRTRMIADRKAADLVGVSIFLAVLNKIMGITGQGNAKKRIGGPFGYFPSLQSRILNLQTYTTSSQTR